MQALYRRYRPQAFDDLIGQDHVADTLRNALRQDRVGHAYLFTGPRGTGKTSTARILAKAVNCLAENIDDRPDNTCSICTAINEGRLLDLIEIDAASNTSVDDVRDLRDRVAFVPSQARYKVYVIDEVHMLSTSAFNALLKTLEEPPAHVIFILATTEPHKIPATVLSRCQRFDFHRISSRAIAAHLAQLAAQEQVSISPEALGIIARSATGSMRDGISLLDQITAYGHQQIDAELVREVLGMVSGAAVSALTDAIASADPAQALAQLHQLIAQGVELNQLISQLIDYLRTLLLLNVGRDASLVDVPDAILDRMKDQAQRFSPAQLLHSIRVLNEAGLALKTPFAGHLPLELALLDAIGLADQPVAAPLPVAARASAAPADQRPPAQAPVAAPPRAAATAAAAPAPAPAAAPAPASGLEAQWQQIVRNMRQYSTRTQAMLRSGHPVAVRGDEFIIGFQFDFHREQVEGTIDRVVEAVSNAMGRPMTVRLVGNDYTPPPPAAAPATDDLARQAEALGAVAQRLSPADS